MTFIAFYRRKADAILCVGLSIPVHIPDFMQIIGIPEHKAIPHGSFFNNQWFKYLNQNLFKKSG
jgi:hypothetical protein